jgi:hypothetical protein
MGPAFVPLLQSAAFWEKLLLLIAGGVLTGFLLPWIKGRIDDKSAWRRKLLEAELSRQQELIGSQIKLLDDASSLFWKFLFAAFRVSYTYAWEDKAERDPVIKAYGPISWELLTSIRAEVSRATRLTSSRTQATLHETYEWLLWLDDNISIMAEQDLEGGVWQTFHQQKFREAAGIIDSTIHALASDLRLAEPSDTSLQASAVAAATDPRRAV